MKKLLLLSLMAIAIQSQAQNVGIGNPAPTEKLDVTGNINVTGTIKANGVEGTAGQVLGKNTSNNMAWVNTANANDVRFRGRFRDETTSANGTMAILELGSSTNSTAVVQNSNSFTINKTGLYHFDVDISLLVPTPTTLTFRPFANLNFNLNGGLPLNVGYLLPYNISDNSSWIMRGAKSFEVHVEAPVNLNISYFISDINGAKDLKCYVFGHLISE